MESGLTTGDIALMDRGGMWGGSDSFMWIFALLILANGGFGGFGRNNFYPNVATQTDVQEGFNFAALERQNNETVAAVRQGVYDTTSAVKDASYNNLGELRDLQSVVSAGFGAMQNCCCDTLRAIDSVNYNGAINTAQINANTTAQTQKILDAIAGNRMADMQNQINQLQLQSALCGVVRYPSAITYNAGYNPFCASGCGNV